MAQKKYPLKIESLCGDGDVSWYSKGHHTSSAFIKALREHDGELYPGEDISRVQHVWWRKLHDFSGEYAFLIHPAESGSRGAFPVTALDR